MVSMAQDLHLAGDVDAAEALCRQVLASEPDAPEALHRLGLIRYGRGEIAAAVALVERALDLAAPDWVGLFASNLGAMLLKSGFLDRAIAVLERAVAAAPDYPGATSNLAAGLSAAGRAEEAAEAHAAQAYRLMLRFAYEPAGQALSEAIRHNPASPRYWTQLGNLHRVQGRRAAALDCYDRALALKPGNLGLMLARAIAQLPVLYADAGEIEAARAAYGADLVRLDQPWPAASLLGAIGEIGDSQPFYLPYQARNDRALQQVYGRFIARVMAAGFSGLPPLPRPAPLNGRRIRVGYVSAYFHTHSVTKLFGGWVDRLDRNRFELIGYDLGSARDALGAALAARFAMMRQGLPNSAAWALAILADRPDVLIYPDLGMVGPALRLAALRLAPVQCLAWGHPTTSGLPSMDYFLSAELMEPAEADAHYTERLIRLPGLSIWLEPPAAPAPIRFDRLHFGLRAEAIVYLCVQSLFKYLPQFDTVFATIAAQVPQAQFLFLNHPTAPDLTKVLRDRLDVAFAAAGLAVIDHVVFCPPVAHEHFVDLLRAGDIYLDSIGWSGGNTTLEAVAVDLPVVTIPTGLMRGRHSAAIMAQMGLRECIALSIADYCSIAIRLGQDGEFRKAIGVEIGQARHRLYRDVKVLAGLENFLADAVESVV